MVLSSQVGHKNDIRAIWVKNIVTVDTSELEKARRELKEERLARLEVEEERARSQLALQMSRREMTRMEQEITRMEREIDDMRRLNLK